MKEKNATFPNGLQAVFLVIASIMAEYVIAAALYDMGVALSVTPEELSGLIMVLGNAVLFTVVMHHKQLSYRALFHSSSSSKTAVVLVLFPAIALTLPLVFLMSNTLIEAAAWAFPLSSNETAMFSFMGSGSFAMVVAICVLAPVLEEMLFRGIILRSFLQQYSRWQAIVGSAAVFGFAHLNLYQYIGAVIMGVFLGWLYERTRSLLPCIALHAAYNATCMMTGAVGAWEGVFDVPATLWCTALLLGLAGFTILRRALGAPAR